MFDWRWEEQVAITKKYRGGVGNGERHGLVKLIDFHVFKNKLVLKSVFGLNFYIFQ